MLCDKCGKSLETLTAGAAELDRLARARATVTGESFAKSYSETLRTEAGRFLYSADRAESEDRARDSGLASTLAKSGPSGARDRYLSGYRAPDAA